MLVLEDNRTRLEQIGLKHVPLLQEVAFEDKLVQYSPTDIMSRESLTDYIAKAIEGYQHGHCLALAIFDKKVSSYAGCSRYMNIDEVNKVLEIGSTWIGRAFQGSGLNTHMKQLMIDHAFDIMGYEKVEFRIDERNIRSRKAVEKLGARLEGILRENVYLLDGYKRNTCCYGILQKDWKVGKTDNKL